jgi:hypothetical protein
VRVSWRRPRTARDLFHFPETMRDLHMGTCMAVDSQNASKWALPAFRKEGYNSAAHPGV